MLVKINLKGLWKAYTKEISIYWCAGTGLGSCARMRTAIVQPLIWTIIHLYHGFHSISNAAYTGGVHKTKAGAECQAWSVVTPHNHIYGDLGDHNQCRNPAGYHEVWCYTTDKNKRWELCDVRQCIDCDKGKKQSYPNWFIPSPLFFQRPRVYTGRWQEMAIQG